MNNFKLLTSLVGVVALSACSGDKKEVVTGEREAILLQDIALKPSKKLSDLPVELPAAQVNSSWPQSGGSQSGVVPVIDLPENFSEAWDISIGGGSDSNRRLLNGPVVHDGVIYVLNSNTKVVAFDEKTGAEIWETPVGPNDSSESSIGGGVAYENGKIYVSTAHAQALALDAKSGAVLWRQYISSPSRSAPAVADGRVYVVSINNELYAMDENSGEILWTHAGIMESAGILGGASPAIANGVVIVPYSSGEVYALRADNGHPLWSESLASFKQVDSVTSLPHIRARPVIDQGMVYLISHSGRMVAINIRDGKVVWDREIGGIQSPAAAGKFLFMVNTDGVLICLTREDGLIKWTKNLPQYVDSESNVGKIVWNGPLLANGQLIVTGSNQEMLLINATDGSTVAQKTLPNRTLLPAIAANKSLFVLTDAGNLVAFR